MPRATRFLLAAVTALVPVTALLTGAGAGSATASTRAPALVTAGNAQPGTYRAVSGLRILDTQNGVGAPAAAVPAESAITVQVTGLGGVPASGVSAVSVNVTASGGTSSGYVTVYPAGTTRPTASSLNVQAGVTVANLVVAKLGTGGSLSLFNGTHGTLQLTADVQGYFLSGSVTAAGAFSTLAPSRLLDTRTGNGATKKAVAAKGIVALKVLGRGGVPTSGVAAVALNVTVTDATQSGYVTAYPGGTTRPTASNLNHVAGQTIAALVFAKVGTGGVVDLYNGSTGAVELVADVAGFYRSGTATTAGAYTAGNPQRLLDTRVTGGALGSGTSTSVTVPTAATSPGSASAAVLNVTVTQPKAAGHITVHPDGYGAPATSTVSFAAGQTIADLVVVPIDSAGAKVDLTDVSGSSVQLVVDLEGIYRNPSFSWSPVRTLDPTHTALAHISCPTTTFCVGVDQAGNATTYDGSTWSQSTSILPTTGTDSPYLHSWVSCTSSTFCVVVDEQGRATVFNGTSWTTPTLADSGHPFDAVSCASSTFCVAVDSDGGAVTYNGSTWSARTAVSGALQAISCPTSSFCAAITNTGWAAMYDGQSWSAATALAAPATEISCASATFCLAADDVAPSAESVTYNGSSWATHQSAPSYLQSISCTSSTFCMGVDGTDAATTYNGTDWDDPTTFDDQYGLLAVSCAVDGHCVLLGGDGTASTYDAGSWSALGVVQRSNVVTGLSCPTTTFCAAVGGDGYAFTYNGIAWSSPVSVGGGNHLGGISCASATFCVAVGDQVAVTYDGQGWSAPTTIDPTVGTQLGPISCASATFCMAGDDSDNIMTFDGTNWSAPTSLGDTGQSVEALSCPTSTFCLSSESGVGTRSFDGASWSAPVANGSQTLSIACPSTLTCVAAGADYHRSLYDGATWQQAPIDGSSGFYRSVACGSASSCLAGADTGFVTIFNGATWTGVANLPNVGPQVSGTLTSCPTPSECIVLGQTGGEVTIGSA